MDKKWETGAALETPARAQSISDRCARSTFIDFLLTYTVCMYTYINMRIITSAYIPCCSN